MKDREWLEAALEGKKKTNRQLKAEEYVRNLEKRIDRKIQDEREERIKSVTPEMEKVFVINFKNGKNLGEAMKIAGFDDTLIAAKILEKYQKTYTYWDFSGVEE